MFGVSAIVVGRWLKEGGLRQPNGEPTLRANEDEFVKRVEPGGTHPFWVWDKRRCIQLLEAAGRKRSGQSEVVEQNEPKLIGPFTSRRSDPESDGFEVVDANGMVGMWLRGEKLAVRIVKLLNIAHSKAGWFA